ncbi:hypothetical protein PR048_005757 [Dryococelus australis]|uniref:Carbohydrate kinase PfkB domain-containing protein n=1 Tax=Dryococelus australis TaxID=614101 RepID=A0ABQ9I937_9NEOP|nr:hypothetical protein PR048_005757 [Dryococelus australis]
MRVKRGEYGAESEWKGGEKGEARENPPTSGIVRHYSHTRKYGSGTAGDQARFARKSIVYCKKETLRSKYPRVTMPLCKSDDLVGATRRELEKNKKKCTDSLVDKLRVVISAELFLVWLMVLEGGGGLFRQLVAKFPFCAWVVAGAGNLPPRGPRGSAKSVHSQSLCLVLKPGAAMPYFTESWSRTGDGQILCVGLACLDSVYVLSNYPIEEDIKERAIDHRWQRGGNASNSSTVLSLLGAKCEYFGTISGKKSASFIAEDFIMHGISTKHCVLYEDCEPPAATVLVNNTNGLRTIVHNESNLPELSLDDFKKLDLLQYSWIHFEGRNVVAVSRMIEEVAKWNRMHSSESELGPIRISVELERPRCGSDILTIVPQADVVFVSKDYAMHKGWSNMISAMEAVAEYTKTSASIIVTWGEMGAAARSPDGSIYHSPGFPPHCVVETLGAGDTFLAAAVFSLSSGHSLRHAITFACRIAGAKVGMYGYSGIRDVFRNLRNGVVPAEPHGKHPHHPSATILSG